MDAKQKGDLGEDAVLDLCLALKRAGDGILIQSFEYPYASRPDGRNYTGNIKWEGAQYVEYTDRQGLKDEIDILLVTPVRIFPIEVKSYHANIHIYDHWMDRTNGGKSLSPVDKSPLAQAEKHARHLYHSIYDVLPDGQSAYIVPIVCFVDRCSIDDDRETRNQTYLPVCVLNNLRQTIFTYNTPLRYGLDLNAIRRKLKEIKTSTRKEFGL